MKKQLTLIGLTAAVLVTPTIVQAEGLSANVAVTSKYKFRGQDQSDETKNVLPAIQGGFDWESGGFYLGNWNSSVGFAGGTEMDFYGGYAGEIGDLSYDVGALLYYYPGSDSSGNTTELYASVGFGPITAKYSHTVSSRWFGVDGGRGTGYLEIGAEFEVTEGITLLAHIGTHRFSSGAKNEGAVNFQDYKVGASFDVGSGFTIEVAYAGANKKTQWGDLNKGRAIFTLSKSL